MLWLALHLPDLPLQACASTWLAAGSAGGRAGAGAAGTIQVVGGEAPPGGAALPLSPADRLPGPLALVARHRITAANAQARALGVQRGQKRSTALALVPALQWAEARPERDAACLQSVVHVALAFTPLVCTEGPSTVLMEVQASLRCFGGPAGLQQRLLAALAPLGLQVVLGVAPTPLAAAWLAAWRPALAQTALALCAPHVRPGPAFQALLDQAPLALLGQSADQPASTLVGLAALGLQNLGGVRALPRAGLARRFGPALLDTLDRALGLRPDPRLALQPPAVFEARLELQARAEHSEPLGHAAALLLPRLLAWAGARQSRVQAFTLRLLHETRHRGGHTPACTELRVELAEPSLDIAHLQCLLHERLQRLELPAPTLDVQLLCQHTVQAAAPNGELFPTRQAQGQGLARLLERLGARLGEAQVLRPAPLADHRPEVANRLLPALGPAPPVAAEALPAPAPGWPLHRPLWLLPEPQPLAELGGQPCWAGQPLRLLAGPQRLETGWWDQQPALRDYYVGQTAMGGLLWVFCHRHHAPACGVGGAPAVAQQLAGQLPGHLPGHLPRHLPEHLPGHRVATPPPRPGPPGEARWFLQGQFG